MTPEARAGGAGFTIVELLMVMAMLGLVTGAIYSTYIAQQRSAASQGEVTEVQQNLRVALDYLSRDLRMAGALVPPGTPPLAAAAGSPAFPSYSTSIVCNTASADGRLARIDADTPVTDGATTVDLTLETPVDIASPNCVDAFAVGDRLRLIRPVDGSQPLSGVKILKIDAISRGGGSPHTAPTMTVSKYDDSAFGPDLINASDLLAKITDTATYPMTVAYFLADGGATVNGFTCPANQRCLVRRVNGGSGGADIVATNLSALNFAYLDDSYHEAKVPASLQAIRAVRITLRGATARTAVLSKGERVREVTTVVKLRNRR
jgi:prepilin-type N-terminal cleavage/methylation domain-containing protein